MEVVAATGMYIVKEKGRTNRAVTKDKRCSCGGDASAPCRHIEAVKQYILAGGEKAKPLIPVEPLDSDYVKECPVCGARTEWARSYTYPLMWRCPKDSAHFWQWYGEKHKVKHFMLGGRQTGIAAIDEMAPGEYREWLEVHNENRDRTIR